mmetsp:Transcript_104399/g.185642  ORF Transcript_104399/g.185642 Transcript_104399/m.185642 type:complete len:666 (+) Transcript_104399:57-2054(+)
MASLKVLLVISAFQSFLSQETSENSLPERHLQSDDYSDYLPPGAHYVHGVLVQGAPSTPGNVNGYGSGASDSYSDGSGNSYGDGDSYTDSASSSGTVSYGNGAGNSYGNGYDNGNSGSYGSQGTDASYGDGDGYGNGNGYDNGNGDGYGDGYGDGDGNDNYGNGAGSGYGSVEYAGPTLGPTATTTDIPTTSTSYKNQHGITTFSMPGTASFAELQRRFESDLAEKENLPQQPWYDEEVPAPYECQTRFRVRNEPPEVITDLNGVKLPPTCFKDDANGLHHVFVIGDWGGVINHYGDPPEPADHRKEVFAAHHRKFVNGADDQAQQNVAKWMKIRAPKSKPDYVINLGDNFYWGGINVQCGAPRGEVSDPAQQWEWIWERFYAGPGLDGVQWLGVLGNHDFGGFLFTSGWDQTIAYTWAKKEKLHFSSGRWMTPALYYSSEVRYSDFTVDWFFVDSNVFDAFDEHQDPGHNICGAGHNYPDASCGTSGPASTEDCPGWFKRLWDAQIPWLENSLDVSTADWQIIATHFPPEHGTDVWRRLGHAYGVDLVVTAHRHIQEVHVDDEANMLKPTAFIVSGGGGGITSEGIPEAHGKDDQYGFMDLTLSKHEIRIEAISHGGQIRSTHCITQRLKGMYDTEKFSGTSLCDGIPSGIQLETPESPTSIHT